MKSERNKGYYVAFEIKIWDFLSKLFIHYIKFASSLHTIFFIFK